MYVYTYVHTHTHTLYNTGLSIHDIRARNSYIRGTNGTSNGLVPMLRCFNSTGGYATKSSVVQNVFSLIRIVSCVYSLTPLVVTPAKYSL